MTLEQEIKEAVEKDGLCELTVRVSRYANLSAAIQEPAAWQAIAKYQGRVSGPWGVGIRAGSAAAIRAALQSGRTGGVTGAVSSLTDDSDGGVFG
jgi:hypothetical protein